MRHLTYNKQTIIQVCQREKEKDRNRATETDRQTDEGMNSSPPFIREIITLSVWKRVLVRNVHVAMLCLVLLYVISFVCVRCMCVCVCVCVCHLMRLSKIGKCCSNESRPRVA